MRLGIILVSLVLPLLAAPFVAGAQPASQLYRIGILNPTTVPPRAFRAFRNRLADLGYVEERTIQFELRNAEGRSERLPVLAADLVRRKVDVLVTMGTQATTAAKEATTTIPIVFLGVASPIEAGIIENLARPGGNVTGATDQLGDFGGKVLQLVSEIVPKGSRIATLVDSTSPGAIQMWQTLDQMAQPLSLTLIRIDIERLRTSMLRSPLSRESVRKRSWWRRHRP